MLDPELSGDESRRSWETQVVNLCFDWLLKTIPSLALVSHWRECFLGRCSRTLSFTLSTWISLEQKHCHFIKCLLWCVFVSDSCYLRIGCHSCSTVEARSPAASSALLKPALPVTLVPLTVVQMNPSSQSQEGRTQPGQTIGYHNPMKYGLKEANKSFKWGQPSSPRTCSVWLSQASPVNTTVVWDHFYTCGGFLI